MAGTTTEAHASDEKAPPKLKIAVRKDGQDTLVEKLLDDWQLPWELVSEYPLDEIDVKEATQVRTVAHRAPADRVQEYELHLANGAVFPPLVVTSTGEGIDFNTRLAALKKLKQETFPAYVVSCGNLEVAKALGAALNQRGGNRLTSEEIVDAAESFQRLGYKDEAIARELGRSTTWVRNQRREGVYAHHAGLVGIKEIKVTKPQQRQLSGIAHDVPFRAAVEAVAATNPSSKEVTALVENMNSARSDMEAVEMVEKAKAGWKPQGPPPQARATTTKATKLAREVAKVSETIAGASEAELVPADPEARERVKATLVAGMDALGRVLAMYEWSRS
jgi:ParB-like chromosome segregation protein Spo0J